MTNSARWLQWKNAAVPPPGDARLDQDIIAQIFLRVRGAVPKRRRKIPRPVLNLTWAYTDPQHPSLAEVAKEINGKALADLKDRESAAGNQNGPAIAGFCVVEGRRNDDVRQLDLFGLWTEAGIADQPARHGRSFRAGDLSELGVVVAGESPGSLQPRVVRSRRQAVGSVAQAGLVERGMRRSGSATTCRTSSPTLIRRITWGRSS